MSAPATGSITIFIGPMFSRKTSSMVDAVERHHLANRNCVIVKYDKDNRYDDISADAIVNHRGNIYNTVPIIRTSSLAEVSMEVLCNDVVGIDEVQFYKDGPEYCKLWADRGLIVICAGLDSTFQGDPFGRVHEICAESEDVIKLKAVCMRCYGDAAFNIKITNDKNIEDIGGRDKYMAVCRKCRNAALKNNG
jgi:thymidine kinase